MLSLRHVYLKQETRCAEQDSALCSLTKSPEYRTPLTTGTFLVDPNLPWSCWNLDDRLLVAQDRNWVCWVLACGNTQENMDRSTNKNLDNQQSKLLIFFIQHRSCSFYQHYLAEMGLRRMVPCAVCPASCSSTTINLDANPLCIMLHRSDPGQAAGPQRSHRETSACWGKPRGPERSLASPGPGMQTAGAQQ